MGAWSGWYRTSRWRQLRARHLARFPLCEFCKKDGQLTAGSIVDHIKPHKGDPILFWDEANFQTLCPTHHSSDKQIIEKGGKPKQRIGIDGFPING